VVKNPEQDHLETYRWMVTRNPYPYASVDRIVHWALSGEVVVLAENPEIRKYFQNLLEETNLDHDTYSILNNILVFGDAYVLLLRNDDGSIKCVRHLNPKSVEIVLNDDKTEKEFIVDYGEFGGDKETYPSNDVLHFRWKPQPDSPYGFSLMKGLEPLVEREHKIMDEFMKALHAQAEGKSVDFDSEGNLQVLKAIPYAFSKHTGVPIGLLTFKIEDELAHKLQMDDFELMCQDLRDLLRNEIIKKVIKPETTRKGFTEIASIGWKRKNKVTAEEMKATMAELKLGLITIEEVRKRLGLTEYYV
jgi:hypothetical protein